MVIWLPAPTSKGLYNQFAVITIRHFKYFDKKRPLQTFAGKVPGGEHYLPLFVNIIENKTCILESYSALQSTEELRPSNIGRETEAICIKPGTLS